jgi:branched-chain amino acid transport system substrate-binding protein
MDHLIGNWWAGGDDDARPAGPAGNGYLSLDFVAVGTDFPVIKDIQKYVIDKGKSQTEKGRVGENFYNRGVLNSIYIAEAIRNAQKLSGKKVIDGSDMRRGLESLNLTDARLKELGSPAPIITGTTRPTWRFGTAPSGPRARIGCSRSKARSCP